jgi:hypothetical protein
MLALEVADEAAVAARMTAVGRQLLRANRGLGYPVVNIPQTAVADDLHEVVGHVRRFKPDITYTINE